MGASMSSADRSKIPMLFLLLHNNKNGVKKHRLEKVSTVSTTSSVQLCSALFSSVHPAGFQAAAVTTPRSDSSSSACRRPSNPSS